MGVRRLAWAAVCGLGGAAMVEEDMRSRHSSAGNCTPIASAAAGESLPDSLQKVWQLTGARTGVAIIVFVQTPHVSKGLKGLPQSA